MQDSKTPPYIMSAEEYITLKQMLLPMFDEQNRTVQRSIVYVLSQLAQANYPHGWPELFTALITSVLTPNPKSKTCALHALFALDVAFEDLVSGSPKYINPLPPRLLELIGKLITQFQSIPTPMIVYTLSLCDSVLSNLKLSSQEDDDDVSEKAKQDYLKFTGVLIQACGRVVSLSPPADGNFVLHCSATLV